MLPWVLGPPDRQGARQPNAAVRGPASSSSSLLLLGCRQTPDTEWLGAAAHRGLCLTLAERTHCPACPLTAPGCRASYQLPRRAPALTVLGGRPAGPARGAPTGPSPQTATIFLQQEHRLPRGVAWLGALGLAVPGPPLTAALVRNAPTTHAPHPLHPPSDRGPAALCPGRKLRTGRQSCSSCGTVWTEVR